MNSTDLESLIQHARACGLKQTAARKWAKDQLKPKPAPKRLAETETLPLFNAPRTYDRNCTLPGPGRE